MSSPSPAPIRSRLVAPAWCLAVPLLALGTPALAFAGSEGNPSPQPAAAVSYQVPREAPTGELQVLSFGVADLPVANLIGTERFVHIRLAALNRTDEREWVMDARDQLLELSDGTRIPARFATSSASAASARIALAQGQRGFLDLFFATDLDPQWTATTWKIRRGQGLIWATTVFERMPSEDSDYAHYRPAHYGGGTLIVGDMWCGPWWGDRWLWPYAGYRRYRYHPGSEGYAVSRGSRRWRYEREHQPIGQENRESVGSRWRRGGSGAERAVVAPPVGAGPAATPAPALAPSHEWTRFRAVAPPASASASGGVDTSSWRRAAGNSGGRPPSDPGSFSRSATWTWSSSSGQSSSSSSTSSPPPSSPSSSSSESSSSSSPAPASAPSSAPSPPSGESVGSRWRSR